MVRPLLLLPRRSAALTVVPFVALLAAACGGTDVVDASDASTSLDAAPDAAHDGGNTGDTGSPDAALVDAGSRDADAGSSLDAEAGLDAGDGGSLLGSANNFAVLAGTAISVAASSPPTIISGDVGVAPGTAIDAFTHPVGTNHAGDAVALQAQADLTKAYNTLAGMACPPANKRSGVDLGGKTLFAGVYCFPNTSAQLTGALVLDAQNNPNAVWVIQVGTTLTTATGSTVTVINGGSACNVHWQIGSSATLGTGTSLLGNVVALSSITFVTGSKIMTGRALARNGGVSFDGSTVNSTTCP